MNVNSVTSNNSFSGSLQTNASLSDSKAQRLQTQLTSARQDLSHISSESEISAEEKAKKRQEIQKQIDELNRKLKLLREQKKAEAKQEAKEQEKKKIITEEMFDEKDSQKKVKEKASEKPDETLEDIELPTVDMPKLYAAQATIQRSVISEKAALQKEGKENILESEIKLDTLHGTDPQAKKEALSKMRRKDPFQIEEINQPEVRKSKGLNKNTKIIITE